MNLLFHIPSVLRLNRKYIAFLSPFLLFPFPLHPSYALARWAFCVNAPQPLSKITNNQPPILIHPTAIDFLLCSAGPSFLYFTFINRSLQDGLGGERQFSHWRIRFQVWFDSICQNTTLSQHPDSGLDIKQSNIYHIISVKGILSLFFLRCTLLVQEWLGCIQSWDLSRPSWPAVV